MPFTNVIDDYSDGATGTLTDPGGTNVGYTITSTSPTVDWRNLMTDAARVNGTGTQTFTVAFDDPVIGVSVQISGSDSDEPYFLVVDGTTVDLNTLIANGDVSFSQSGSQTHVINADGSISGGRYNDRSLAEIVFNTPVETIGVFGTSGDSTNWDVFEVGIDSTVFEVVCFAAGTSIATEDGPRPVEALRVGDMVLTTASDSKPVRWIGSRKYCEAALQNSPKLRPVRILAGALGNGMPERDLLVSRQHRLLVSSKIAKRVAGSTDVLVPAIKLTDLPGIFVDDSVTEVTYFHLLFDAHEVILADGAPAESLFTGPEALKALPQAAREEILTIFPELTETESETACPTLTGEQLRQLVARHAKNQKPLLEMFDRTAR